MLDVTRTSRSVGPMRLKKHYWVHFTDMLESAGPFLMPTDYKSPLYTSDIIHIDVGDKHGFLPKDGSRSHILKDWALRWLALRQQCLLLHTVKRHYQSSKSIRQKCKRNRKR